MNCIFCEFIKGRKIHQTEWTKSKLDYPVIKIFETKEVFSFLSYPDNKGETHLLIIPKKHYEFLENIPDKILDELFQCVVIFAGIIRKKYGDCHILLNNGKNAEQYINHVHFHLIPKNENKKPLWLNLLPKEFEKLSNKLKKDFHGISIS